MRWHYITTTSPTVAAMRQALYNFGPLVTTMDVYEDFQYYKSGIYSHTAGQWVGGHVVLLTGYDDSNRCFIAKNSWGGGWGEGGFFRIDYSELASAVEFGWWTLAYEGIEFPDNGCSYQISLNPTSVSDKGGFVSGLVRTQKECTWTVTSNNFWIRVDRNDYGKGSGRFYLAINSANSPQVRTGKINVQGRLYTISQRHWD